MFIRSKKILTVLVVGFAPSCANPGLAWAPRHPGPARPPKPAEDVRVVALGRPDCDYRVIGTAFGTSLDELRETARFCVVRTRVPKLRFSWR